MTVRRNPAQLLVLLAATACGARSPGSTDTHSAHDPVHDPARMWTGESQVRAEQPAAPGDRRVPATVPVQHAAPAIELRAFSEAELERIQRVQTIVREAAMEHGVPPNLVNGIIWVESKFLPAARGKRGPRGLMQIMPRTGREIARALERRYDPHDPDFNIHAGTYYFARMMERFDNDPTLALAAYNIGPAVVRRWLAATEPFGEATNRYIERVLAAAHAFRERGF